MVDSLPLLPAARGEFFRAVWLDESMADYALEKLPRISAVFSKMIDSLTLFLSTVKSGVPEICKPLPLFEKH
jgi:hypothetical protein